MVQLGALAVVLAASTYRVFELDRFFVPKEVALHATALLAGLLALRACRRLTATRTDALLAGFVTVSAVSALFATNGWLAFRALAVSTSGIALFWTARALRRAGLGRPLVAAIAVAAVAGCATALLQAYGVMIDLFTTNRAPGGTLGNRNFVAHMAAFSFPVVAVAALRARTARHFWLAVVGVAIVVAALVLTRSRAGWLAFAAAAVVLVLVTPLAAPALRRDLRTWLRLSGMLLVVGAGIAGAVLVPNTLRWRSENPYLESIRGVANYQEGSGRGRLLQYRRSLEIVRMHPLLGAGPGNWTVLYPEVAAAGDPSMDRSAPGTTSNPWPSSDWVAFVSERGVAATALLALAMLAMATRAAVHLVRTPAREEALGAGALLGVLAASVVAGLFDAVLLLALPALLVWTALGALWPEAPPDDSPAAGDVTAHAPGPAPAMQDALARNPVSDDPVAYAPASTQRLPWPLLLVPMLLVAVAAAATARSVAQLTAIHIFETRSDVTVLSRAAALDPGNYRLRLRLAREAPTRAQRCEHARAAHALLPGASAARTLNRRCG